MYKPEIKCISSETVYRNQWMTVREDKILRAKAGEGIYGVIEKSDFAVIAAVEDDLIYLVEQYRYPVENRFWELPQGSWEKDNIDASALAASELREETGLIARSIVHIGHLFVAYGYSNQGYNIFLATELEQHSAQVEPEEEGLVAKAFSIMEFEKMIYDGTIKDATTIAVYGLLKLKKFL